jgi:hypothetical protein
LPQPLILRERLFLELNLELLRQLEFLENNFSKLPQLRRKPLRRLSRKPRQLLPRLLLKSNK